MPGRVVNLTHNHIGRTTELGPDPGQVASLGNRLTLGVDHPHVKPKVLGQLLCLKRLRRNRLTGFQPVPWQSSAGTAPRRTQSDRRRGGPYREPEPVAAGSVWGSVRIRPTIFSASIPGRANPTGRRRPSAADRLAASASGHCSGAPLGETIIDRQPLLVDPDRIRKAFGICSRLGSGHEVFALHHQPRFEVRVGLEGVSQGRHVPDPSGRRAS